MFNIPHSWLGNLTYNYWVFTCDPMKYWDNMGGDARDYKDKKIKSCTSNLKQEVSFAGSLKPGVC